MKKAPWARGWLSATPEQFEQLVISYLESLRQNLKKFSIRHRVSLGGPDGEFELDGLAQFEALGAEFMVVIECKHHKNPVKRETVQVVRDRVRSLSAHKGMVFSTGGFQSGAIEYAQGQRIALIHFTEGGAVYETKGHDRTDVSSRACDAYYVSLDREGAPVYRLGGYSAAAKFLFSS